MSIQTTQRTIETWLAKEAVRGEQMRKLLRQTAEVPTALLKNRVQMAWKNTLVPTMRPDAQGYIPRQRLLDFFASQSNANLAPANLRKSLSAGGVTSHNLASFLEGPLPRENRLSSLSLFQTLRKYLATGKSQTLRDQVENAGMTTRALLSGV